MLLRLALCVLALLPLTAQADLAQAARLMRLRKFGAAQALVDKALRGNPQDAEALALAGDLQLRQANYARAQELAEPALKLNPNLASAHLLRGNCLGAQMDKVGLLRKMSVAGEIRTHFEKAVQADPRNRDARSSVFMYYVQAPGMAGGGLDKARAFAEQTLGVDTALGHALLARLHQRKKDLGAAQAEYRKALEADPKYLEVLNDLGYVELAMKQVDDAIAHFRQAAALEPEDPNAHDSLGDGLKAKGALDEALAAYRKALALDPTFPPALLHLGEALEQKGFKDEAAQAYRRCAALPNAGGNATRARERLKALGLS